MVAYILCVSIVLKYVYMNLPKTFLACTPASNQY